MTTATFKYLDPSSVKPSTKPWSKVDGPGYCAWPHLFWYCDADCSNTFTLADHTRPVTDLRTVPHPSSFTTDTAGFSVIHSTPSHETSFTDPTAIRTGYYAEVESLLRQQLPKIAKVVIFDHTIRRHDPTSPRQPVQQVHVDQTPRAAEARVRRHVTDTREADELLKRRYQIINVWRPISHPASDYPLALVDWRTTRPEDFVKVDLMYPLRSGSGSEATPPESWGGENGSGSSSSNTNGVNGVNGVKGSEDDDDDDRGHEVLPDPSAKDSTVGYEVKGETLVVAPRDTHRFYYVRDMTPEEVVLIKCFDSRSVWMNDEGYVSGDDKGVIVQGKGLGREGVAMGTAHTAFVDPTTPVGAKGRESIEVRCLVFYED